MWKVQGCVDIFSKCWPIKYTQYTQEVTLVVIENIDFLKKGDKLENICRESFRYLQQDFYLFPLTYGMATSTANADRHTASAYVACRCSHPISHMIGIET